jgi:hypothetical protein
MSTEQFIYKSNGNYLGFIRDGLIFSRDGIYLGWIEAPYVWDASGRFRGILFENKYILNNKLTIPAISRPAKIVPNAATIPNSPPNVNPIQLPIGVEDSFN